MHSNPSSQKRLEAMPEGLRAYIRSAREMQANPDHILDALDAFFTSWLRNSSSVRENLRLGAVQLPLTERGEANP
jgi:hypothetical protein